MQKKASKEIVGLDRQPAGKHQITSTFVLLHRFAYQYMKYISVIIYLSVTIGGVTKIMQQH